MSFKNEFAYKLSSLFLQHKPRFKTNTKTYDLNLVRMIGPSPYDYYIGVGDEYKVLALIEIRENIYSSELFENQYYQKYIEGYKPRYLVITDYATYIIRDLKKNKEITVSSFEEFINEITSFEKIDVVRAKITIIEIINSSILENEFFENSILKAELNLHDFSLTKNICFDEITQEFYFGDFDNLNSFENRFFNSLLNDFEIKKVYRYTSLNSNYLMITKNSVAMQCVVGMNDTTEVNYVDNYILGGSKSYDIISPKEIESFNNTFILSCTDKDDDLTLFRLYADDSKGVCLEFDVTIAKENFVISKISYANQNKIHPELDIVKRIINQLKSEGISFIFKSLDIWKHFFKPYDYKDEQEIRVLYKSKAGDKLKKGWVMTNSHNILNSHIDFPLIGDKFPLKLRNITLGPKYPERDVNKKQLEYYIHHYWKNLTSKCKSKIISALPKVSVSQITNYR